MKLFKKIFCSTLVISLFLGNFVAPVSAAADVKPPYSSSWIKVGTNTDKDIKEVVYYYKESGKCIPREKIYFYNTPFSYSSLAPDKGYYNKNEAVYYDRVYVSQAYFGGRYGWTAYQVSWISSTTGQRRYMTVTYVDYRGIKEYLADCY